MTFWWILGFSMLGSIGAIAGAALLLTFPDRVRRTLVPCLISYATGTLLAAAFLGMIPAGLKQEEPVAITATVLAGIVMFFVLEKIVLWRHCHEGDCPAEHGRAAPLILIGDAFHNFVDGIVIAAGFLTSIPLGIAASFAVVMHEFPQEVGDFAILLDAGYSKTRAIVMNTLSASATIPGALMAWAWLAEMREAIPFILAISAASFIYIATADLIPELHRKTSGETALRQLVLLLTGIATIVIVKWLQQ
jgi:zinc and cadmium transporter